jgi:hypothetical protein
LLIPERLKNSYVVVKVDNTSCFYGWLNKQSPGDETASVLIRTLHLICSAISCDVHIDHLPRMSSAEAETVDRLSRDRSTTLEDKKLIRQYGDYCFPRPLLEWMKAPYEDWLLPEKLLNEVLKKLK